MKVKGGICILLLAIFLMTLAVNTEAADRYVSEASIDTSGNTINAKDQLYLRYSRESDFFNNDTIWSNGLIPDESIESALSCGGWEDETTVNYTGNSPNIIHLDNGTLFTAYLIGEFLETSSWWASIRHSQSYDNGTSWSGPFYLAGAQSSVDYLDPSCIQLRNSRILCTFSDADSIIFTTYSDDYGSTWSNLDLVYEPYGFVPDLLELSNGHILLAFTEGITWQIGGIKVMKSTDGGVTWSAPVLIYDNPLSYDSKVDLLQLNDGTILAGFYTNESGTKDLKLLKSYNNGDTWTDKTDIVVGPGDQYWISLLQFDNGEVWAAFNNGNSVALVKSSDGGTTWSNEEFITYGYWPSLIQLPDGTVITAFATERVFPDFSEINIIKRYCSVSDTIPVPTIQQSFTYPPIASPVISSDPAQARPIGVGSVATGGDTFNLQIGLNQFAGPVDIYLMIYVPAIDPNYYLIAQDNILYPFSAGNVPKWRENTVGPIDEVVIGDTQLSSLESATYYLYAVVTPAGDTSFNYHYLWETYFAVNFLDVPATYWAYSQIMNMVDSNIMSGCGEKYFCPWTLITRAMTAEYIIKAMGETPSAVAYNAYFDDLSSYVSVAGYINRIYELRITGGCGTRRYCPDATLNRAQMAVLFIRALYGNTFSYGSTPYFSDIPDTHWAFKYIQKMYEDGISTGYGDGTYGPGNTVTKAEMALFLSRAFPE